MKKRLILLLLLLPITQLVIAQALTREDETTLRLRLDQFIAATKSEDFAKVIDYTYPKILEMASRDQLIGSLKAIEAMGLEMIFDEIMITKLELVHEDGSDKYALAKYEGKLRIILTSRASREDDATVNILSAFKAQYGDNAVTYDQSNYTINIDATKYLVCIRESAYEDKWFFLEYDQNRTNSLAYFLSDDILDEVSSRVN